MEISNKNYIIYKKNDRLVFLREIDELLSMENIDIMK
jgi:hypothetical protein